MMMSEDRVGKVKGEKDYSCAVFHVVWAAWWLTRLVFGFGVYLLGLVQYGVRCQVRHSPPGGLPF